MMEIMGALQAQLEDTEHNYGQTHSHYSPQPPWYEFTLDGVQKLLEVFGNKSLVWLKKELR
jgi:hypothetical protein